MANNKNLIPLNKRTPRERKEISRKGAQATNELKRKRKSMREQMEMLLSLPLDKDAKASLKELGIDSTDDMNKQMALLVATYNQAMCGDTKATNIIRELVGEKVTEIKVSTSIDDKVKQLNELLK